MPEDVTVDTVGDDEILYRRVPRNTETNKYYTRGSERVQVLTQAFSERAIPSGKPHAGQYRLSVDRAKLRDFRPELTQQDATQGDPADYGVVCMPARDVRAIPKVDNIVPDPILNDPPNPDNPAHALICVQPSLDNTASGNKKILREVIAELADLANRTPWPIEPRD